MTALTHFVGLANRGRLSGSSSGAKHARQLALSVCEHVTSLDDQALEGLCDYIRSAKLAPETARDLIAGWESAQS